ncbi:MAG TPA: hypothetical protein VJM83_03755, partial [Nitrospirota bacterium]|nr:hypothetical protein [Nitrospirota bacterium]
AVKRVDAVTGIISTIAGNGSSYGPFRDGVDATRTSILFPKDVAVDGSGNVYVIELAGARSRLRKVDARTGKISTIKGSPSDAAEVSAAPDGSLCVTGADRVYRVDPGTGKVAVIAGNGKKGYSGDGGPAAGAALGSPHGAVSDGINLYIADTENNRIRRVRLK